ncbi:DUF881 domain-containing protein [Streptomyces coffeae]|uniref:DUF881 domain-containing protein n=1 Tax=Streptomyces coffeae TaxID=621382 RepID=A0ABS1NKU9_9ACTN|nr:DUF881 domain-containing protein [Streptomyces coffeae]MBL1100731.1 DUF881 domain-containing protein [Streptomyces coffeae]
MDRPDRPAGSAAGRPLRPEQPRGERAAAESGEAQRPQPRPADGAKPSGAKPPGARPSGPQRAEGGASAAEPGGGQQKGSRDAAGPAPERPDGPDPDGPDRPGPDKDAAEKPLTGRQRLVKGLWPPRMTRAQLIVALLLFGLGLGLAIQVRSTNENSVLRGARQEDLVRILDELDDRTQRLQDEKRRLEGQRTELENSSDQAEEARKQTLQKEQQLGVLAGTVGAQGPGITMKISDSRGAVEADMLLDTVQELRAAGAEAIQIGKVRVVANTYFADTGGGVEIDGHRVTRPYVVKVIGKPEDLEPALNIPGGVVQSLEKEQATVSIVREKKIVVDALRSTKRPDYARSSSR